MTPLALIIAILLQASPSPNATAVPPAPVREALYPILDALSEAESHYADRRSDQQNAKFNAGFDKAARLIDQLSQRKTENSDEALVVLLNFYVGEATGEDLLHDVTKRAKRMLPLLLKYRDKRVTFPDRSYPASIILDSGARRQNFDDAINAIRAGKVLGDD